MPPRAIPSAVRCTIRSDSGSALRTYCRSRNSSTIDGGNFGAPAKPPCTSSKPRASSAAASSSSFSVSGSTSPSGFGAGVDVRALLAVHLDADEPLVHQRRGLLILERLVRHHVAPVAGGVPHGQQHRHVAPPRLLERPGGPRPPVDRVVGVLEQVGRGGVGQPVRHTYILARSGDRYDPTGGSPGNTCPDGARACHDGRRRATKGGTCAALRCS